MLGQMGMGDDKGAEDEWASITRRMVTDAVKQVEQTYSRFLHSIAYEEI